MGSSNRDLRRKGIRVQPQKLNWQPILTRLDRSKMAQFTYDESGGTSLYFLVSFYALVLFPLTYYLWPSKEKKGKAYSKISMSEILGNRFKLAINRCRMVFSSRIGCQILHCTWMGDVCFHLIGSWEIEIKSVFWQEGGDESSNPCHMNTFYN